ncbi:MAG TPA: DNA translocase FtsK 4TM domain-containing protein [Candidatus Limnocylindrales bacterium]|nr:DNA translocase FtsK 4TM domain-containing protein [Candidatus Limnocylindrales bacterium]
MAARRRTATTTRRRRRSKGFPVNPEVARSIVGIVLLVLGAVTLIALALPGRGSLTDWWRDSIAPWFETGRWLLPFLLLGAGWYVEWGPGKRPGSGWGMTLLGIAIAYVGFLGAFEVLNLTLVGAERGGGRIGRFEAGVLAPLLTAPGAFVVLLAIGVIGLMLAFNLRLRQVVRPVTGTAKWVGGAAAASMRREPQAVGPGKAGSTNGNGTKAKAAAGAAGAKAVAGGASSPGQTGIWGGEAGDRDDKIPAAVPSSVPTSATFARGAAGEGLTASATLVADRPARTLDDVTDAGDSPPTKERIDYTLPPLDVLDDVAVPIEPGGSAAAHARNEEIIVRKLASFGIDAKIVGRNAGPVVTQYEVQPAVDVRVSRIEALADDLAMALAARSLRIEAPIPGKSAVGIEIPNQDFNVVALRRVFVDVPFSATESKLTFALGRDVAGRAQAVDLAKMPHLLIAGATGSGKSVMVNAVITSLLCKATPDDVRMILMDLKRVELASYNGLPHLMVPVITEPGQAKSALKWAVGEMEGRYRKFAGASARNIAAYNESRADPNDRLPYIVIIIDELADLMMREGKHVEDPIVRLAQKARATGIHMVLATQRPSVNVVTGLIKANFPSRIAFAMASQIDSRTILDAPGAEDLIGRGDMLYQPSDLPRPMRLQGVFVSDAEIGRVVHHWTEQIENPHYDMAIIESDEESTGSVEDVADDDADRLLPDAIEVIREYDRASASLLQRRLKVGYARAARIIDQLEARGYIGAFDGSNARQVLRRDGGPATQGVVGADADEDTER